MTEQQEFYKCPRIALGIPSHDQWMAETALSVAALVGYTAEKYISQGAMEIRFVTCNGTILGDMRNAIVEKALDLECSHILWIDADMKFPPNSLERLLMHSKPVVGCNYARRRRPVRPTAASLPTESNPNGELIYEEGQTGLEEIQYLGMGLCLTETSVFSALPKPWFFTGWNPKTEKSIGEDVHFFRMLPGIGCPVHLDHDLSRDVRHIGLHTYTHTDALEDRPQVLAIQETANVDNELRRAEDSDSELAGEKRPDGPDS